MTDPLAELRKAHADLVRLRAAVKECPPKCTCVRAPPCAVRLTENAFKDARARYDAAALALATGEDQ